MKMRGGERSCCGGGTHAAAAASRLERANGLFHTIDGDDGVTSNPRGKQLCAKKTLREQRVPQLNAYGGGDTLRFPDCVFACR